MCKKIEIEEVTTQAVQAALAVIDEATDGTSKQSNGPAGDKLAGELHELISEAVRKHFAHPLYAPGFIEASDLEYQRGDMNVIPSGSNWRVVEYNGASWDTVYGRDPNKPEEEHGWNRTLEECHAYVKERLN